MTDGDLAGVDEAERAESALFRRWLAGGLVVLVLALALIAAGVAYGIQQSGSEGAASHMSTMAGPLDLSSVDATIAGHYRYAKAHAVAFSQVPCYCGCERAFGHRNLADCFVRPDDGDWEAHAVGCAVCNGEAATAQTLLEHGKSPPQVRDAVIAKFGSTLGTTPATSGPPSQRTTR